MRRTTTLLVTILCLAVLVLGFCVGRYTFKPQIKVQVIREPPTIQYVEVPVEKTITVPVEKIVEVPTNKTVTVERTIIKTVERSKPLGEFPSKQALVDWLTEDDTDIVVFTIPANGTIVFATAGSNPNYDCDDFAVALQQAAMKDGYIINVQVDVEKAHAINSALIGNDIFFIEPQTDQIWEEMTRE